MAPFPPGRRSHRAPAGYKAGDHHPDPYASDAPVATITAVNVGSYDGKLTAGELAC